MLINKMYVKCLVFSALFFFPAFSQVIGTEPKDYSASRNTSLPQKPWNHQEGLQVAEKPGAPQYPLQIIHAASHGLTLRWNPSLTNGSLPITHYSVYQSEIGRLGNTTSPKTTEYNVTNRFLSSKIVFRVVAVSPLGESDYLESRPFSKPGKPKAPFKISSITADGIVLTWNPPLDNGGLPITHYSVSQYDYGKRKWQNKGNTTTGNITSYIVAQVTTGSHINPFRVAAVNQLGKSDDLESVFSYKPNAPRGPITITNFTTHGLILAWSPLSKSGSAPITHYSVDQYDTKIKGWIRIGQTPSNASYYNVTNLIPGNEYKFRVAAVNGLKKSDYLESESFYKPSTPRGPVTLTIANAQGVTLRWNPPLNNGSLPITHYNIYQYDNDKRIWTCVGDTIATSSSAYLTNLMTSPSFQFRRVKIISLWFRIAAVSQIGESDFLESRVFHKPSTPTGPIIITTESGVKLRWNPPSDNGGIPITHYVVEQYNYEKRRWQPTGNTTSANVTLFATTNTSTTPFAKYGYLFKVAAVNQLGKSDYLQSYAFHVPAIPRGPLQVTNGSARAMQLNWNAPLDNGGLPITHYVVEQYNYERRKWQPKGNTTTGNITSFTMANTLLGPKQGNIFRVAAVNHLGKSNCLQSNAFHRPGIPRGPLQVTNATARGVTLKWNPPLDSGGLPITHYSVSQYNFINRKWYPKGNSKNTTTYTLAKITPANKYLFRVEAVNPIGKSNFLNSRSFTKPSKPRAPLKATDIAPNGVKLTWNPPMDDGGLPIIHYVIEQFDISRQKWYLQGNSTHTQIKTQLMTKSGFTLRFRVAAVNLLGSSDYLATASSCTINSRSLLLSSLLFIIMSSVIL